MSKHIKSHQHKHRLAFSQLTHVVSTWLAQHKAAANCEKVHHPLPSDAGGVAQAIQTNKSYREVKQDLLDASNDLCCILESFLELYKTSVLDISLDCVRKQKQAIELTQAISLNLIRHQCYYYLKHVNALAQLTRILKHLKALNPKLPDGDCWYQQAKPVVRHFAQAAQTFIWVLNHKS